MATVSPGGSVRRVGAMRHGGRRIGLLGGSFNPAHGGHRYISVEALRRLRLDEVWWLVSPQNPLKEEKGMAALDERVARAADVARHPRIRVTALEAELGTRYTIDTVRALKRRFPAARFVWLMGADNLVQMPRWRCWSQIFNAVAIAVFARGSYDSKALSGLAAQRFRAARLPARASGLLADCAPPAWVFLPVRHHPAQATALRRAGRWPES